LAVLWLAAGGAACGVGFAGIFALVEHMEDSLSRENTAEYIQRVRFIDQMAFLFMIATTLAIGAAVLVASVKIHRTWRIAASMAILLLLGTCGAGLFLLIASLFAWPQA
jgi:hypothetical protein